MTDVLAPAALPPVSTGVTGLDAILGGGLPPSRLYLVEGSPGTGKTTLSLQFLRQAIRDGRRALYVTLSESAEEMTSVAASHGWSLDGIALLDHARIEDMLSAVGEQTVLHSWDVELGETVRLITDRVTAEGADCVVLDSLSELRLMAQDPLRYRRQVLLLKRFFAERGATVLLTDDLSSTDAESLCALHSLCHGVISLTRRTLDYGGARRHLEVVKLRGVDFVAGHHDYEIRHGGLEVYPRLIAAGQHAAHVGGPTPSGLPALDAMLGGGPLRGTSTLVIGPAGSGKTNLVLQYVDAACKRGERVVLYQFDERIGTLLLRAGLMGKDLKRHVDDGLLAIRQIDPAQLSPGEFSSDIQAEVRERGTRMVVVDSLAGYMASMPQEQQLVLQLHELLAWLNQQGVVTFLINTQHSLVGSMATGGINISYLSDAVLLLRFFEFQGRIRKAISVLKNRGGAHSDALHELRIDAEGLRVGPTLGRFRGVLTGVPTYLGDPKDLLDDGVDGG